MSIRLFKEDETYNEHAHIVVKQFVDAVSPIVEDLFRKGFSMRDVMLVLTGEVECICLEKIMIKNLEKIMIKK